MASPQIITFFIFDPSTGNPVTGHAGSMSFVTYKDETGSNLSPPSIVEIGGGGYYFTPSFASPNHGIAYCIDTGSENPAKISGYLRPEDFFPDEIDLIRKLQTNKWQIFPSGGNANQMIIYDDDGSTPLLTLNLFDASGAPTAVNPFNRTPV